MKRAHIRVTGDILRECLHLPEGTHIWAIEYKPYYDEFVVHLRGEPLPDHAEVEDGEESVQLNPQFTAKQSGIKLVSW